MDVIGTETLLHQRQAELHAQAEHERLARAARSVRRDGSRDRRIVRWAWRSTPAAPTAGAWHAPAAPVRTTGRYRTEPGLRPSRPVSVPRL